MIKKNYPVKLTAVTASLLTLLCPLSAFAEGNETTETTELIVGDTVILEQSFDDREIKKWSPFGGGMLSVNEETGHSGGISLKITGRSNPYDGPSIFCDELVNAGEAYNFNGWIYHESDTTETFLWTIRARDQFGSDSYSQITTANIEPRTWTYVSASALIPEDSISTLIYFECNNASLDFSVDDIKIVGNANEKHEETKEIPDKINMDFEEDFDNWAARGDVTVAHTDEYSKSGKYSIYSTNRTQTWNAPTVHITDKIIKGESYYYSAYVMYNGEEYENSHGFRMEIQYNIDGGPAYNLVSAKTLKKGKWTKIEGYYTVPEEAEGVYLYIQTDNVEESQIPDRNDLMSYYVDNVTICKSGIHKKEMLSQYIVTGAIAVIIIILIILIFTAVFKRIKNKSKVLELALQDAMTGVYNRNTYEKKVEELEAEGEKFKSLYFALCDVNFLKYINDNFGHEAGDEAIIRCAKMLSSVIGKSGAVYRIGGDEFVCISKSDFKEALLAEIKKESAIDKKYPYEIACGFVNYDEKKYPTVKDIITQCDKEMYANKQEIKAKNKEFSRK